MRFAFLASVALVTTLISSAHAQSNLPPAVRAELLAADAGDAIKTGDFALALKKLEEYRTLGIAVPPGILYLEARAALAADDLIRSKRVFEEYFSGGGQTDPNYKDALDFYRKMLPAAEAQIKIKADADAAQAKQAADEKIRARQEAITRLEADAASRAQYVKDCDLCPEMSIVPAGPVMIDQERSVDIKRPFAVARTEVTFAQWDACVAAKGCAYVPDDNGWGRGDRPVINVSWDDAQVYIRWLNRTTKQNYRLLSESEWSSAARLTPEPTGGFIADATTLCLYGNVPDASLRTAQPNAEIISCEDGVGASTTTVASYAPNAWGLYDMAGNVWEWVNDCWSETQNARSVDEALVNGLLFGGCASGQRTVRGRSWFNGANSGRGYDPQNARYNNAGFRIARSISAPTK